MDPNRLGAFLLVLGFAGIAIAMPIAFEDGWRATAGHVGLSACFVGSALVLRDKPLIAGFMFGAATVYAALVLVA